MTDENVIPTTSEQWRNCIEVHCRIPLTSTFIAERLNELQNSSHAKTKEFAKFYGENYLQQVILWFRQAADESS